MLRGVTKIENDVAMAIESALPYSTSRLTGWKEVTLGRKKIVVAAARAALTAVRKKYIIKPKPRNHGGAS
jgi:hypothetical protein